MRVISDEHNMTKTGTGNFFEDFRIGQMIQHATPRTVTVRDVSLNAVANLGYAGCRFLAPVYPGDTLNAVSEVIGLKENSSRKTGIVFVRSTGLKQDGTKVLEYVRWVMVHKRDEQ